MMDGTAWIIITTLAGAIATQSSLLLRATLARLRHADEVIENHLGENTKALQQVAELMRGCNARRNPDG